MNLKKIVEDLNMDVHTGEDNLDVDVTGGYSSDLLSDVIGNAQEGHIWITLQTHQNIVAVAVMKSLAGIILISGREPDEETKKKADEEDVPILTSDLSTFELIGQLYQMGVRGN